MSTPKDPEPSTSAPPSRTDNQTRSRICVDELTLEEKLQLFSGSDAWHFCGVKRLGLPPLQVADCGHGVTLVAPPYGSATCFPTSVGMAATWNRELIEEVGKSLGRETRAKGCSMLLGPMVNLHRLPCGGRNYETFSEDPVLTARLAAALVRGIQSEGTGACVKSFACNNQQTAQKHTSSEVDEETLSELYLKVYALILREVAPWAMMTSYNPVNGEHPSDSAALIDGLLRQKLGFQGVVVSDWSAVEKESALYSGIDIEMPGPAKVLRPENFKAALQAGQIDPAEIDRRASRLLDLHARTQPAREGDARYSPPELNSMRHQAVARQVAEEGIVLLQNRDGLLPFDPAKVKRVALIGPNAAAARIGGGGSASVLAPYAISPLQGLRDFADGRFEVVFAEGCSLADDSIAIPPEAFTTGPESDGESGLAGSYYSIEAFARDEAAGARKTDAQIDFSWGWAAPAEGIPRVHFAARWEGFLQRPTDGPVQLSVSTNEGIARVWVGGTRILDCWTEFDRNNFEERYQNRQAQAAIDFGQSPSLPIRIEFEKTGTRAGIRLAWTLPGGADPIAAAAEMSAQTDCAIVVAGLSNMHEGGGSDRVQFALPGRQEALITAVAAANPRTAVVLYNGTPVSMRSWRDQVPAIVEAFYPGQEGGAALARILFGEVCPSGRLPDTFPKSWDEVPAMANFPGKDGRVHFREGRFVGYRHYDRAEIEPEFPFGFGLSYTQFSWGSIKQTWLPGSSGTGILRLQVALTNTGACDGQEVVQVYLERLNPRLTEPVRELLDFVKIKLAAGESAEAVIDLHAADLTTPSGGWRLALGPHSRDLRTVQVPPPPFPYP